MNLDFWCESEKEREHYENLDIGGRIILKWILEKQNEVILTALIWLRIGTTVRLL
jgi:hypothetical protein